METSANTGWARICILRSNFAVSWYIVLPLCCWCLDDADRTHEAETCDSFIGRTAWTEVFFCPVPACLLWCRDLRSVDVSCHAEVEGMPVMGYVWRWESPSKPTSRTPPQPNWRSKTFQATERRCQQTRVSWGLSQLRIWPGSKQRQALVQHHLHV